MLKRWSLLAYGTEEDYNSGDYITEKDLPSKIRSPTFSSEPKLNLENSPISSQTPAFSFPLNSSSSNGEKFPPIITKTTTTTIGMKEQEGIQTSDSQIFTYNSNVTSGSSSGEATSNSNRKPSRQRQNKGKNVSKKQKVATLVPPLTKNLESHVIITSDDEEFKRLLKLKFNLSQNQSSTVSEDIKSGESGSSSSIRASPDAAILNRTLFDENNTPVVVVNSSPIFSSTFPPTQSTSKTSSSSSNSKTEQNRSVLDEKFFINGTTEASMEPNEELTTTIASVNDSLNITGL